MLSEAERDPGNMGILEVGGGIAAIVDPASNYIGGPLEHEEGIIYAEIDLEKLFWRSTWWTAWGIMPVLTFFTVLFNSRKLSPVERLNQLAGEAGIDQEIVKAIKILKNNLHRFKDEEIVLAIETLASMI